MSWSVQKMMGICAYNAIRYVRPTLSSRQMITRQTTVVFQPSNAMVSAECPNRRSSRVVIASSVRNKRWDPEYRVLRSAFDSNIHLILHVIMLNLANLRSLLLQVLSLPSLHTAVLFTPEGHLVSYASDPTRSKDEVRVVVGLSGDIWQETKEQAIGMVESEVCLAHVLPLPPTVLIPLEQLGRLLVASTEPPAPKEANGGEAEAPILLLALNGDHSVSWKEMERKVRLPSSPHVR